MLNLIPMPVRILGATLLLVGAFIFGYMKGNARAEAEIQKFSAKAAQQIAELEKKNAQTTNKIVTEYVDRVRTVKEKEYVYITKIKDNVPSQYYLSNGWVYGHDLSTTNDDADSTRLADATPSEFKDNQALETIVSNYATCKANAEQLIALQKWIVESQAAVVESNKKRK